MASQILLNVTGKQMCNSKLLQVPTQKAAYAAIQNSLIHSKAADERNSVSAMSGVSSASGGSQAAFNYLLWAHLAIRGVTPPSVH